jgi:hypothetical protein
VGQRKRRGVECGFLGMSVAQNEKHVAAANARLTAKKTKKQQQTDSGRATLEGVRKMKRKQREGGASRCGP